MAREAALTTSYEQQLEELRVQLGAEQSTATPTAVAPPVVSLLQEKNARLCLLQQQLLNSPKSERQMLKLQVEDLDQEIDELRAEHAAQV